MAAPVRRVSPLKPGLTGARNWATAQVRAASYTRKGFWRLTLSILFIVFSIGFLGLWLGGFLPDAHQSSQNFVKNRLSAMGFVVERVDVMGEGRLRESDVVQALGVMPGDYLFDLDIKAAQKRVENLSWVERAIVRRLWPDRIVVQIIERKPYALWQNEETLHLVDKEGGVIALATSDDYSVLPLIVGTGAPENFSKIQDILIRYPRLEKRTYAMVHYDTGRWDVVLNEGDLRVKLPSKDIHQSLQRLKALQSRTQLLDRDISVIDLRLSDRISLSPSADEPV